MTALSSSLGKKVCFYRKTIIDLWNFSVIPEQNIDKCVHWWYNCYVTVFMKVRLKDMPGPGGGSRGGGGGFGGGSRGGGFGGGGFSGGSRGGFGGGPRPGMSGGPRPGFGGPGHYHHHHHGPRFGWGFGPRRYYGGGGGCPVRLWHPLSS